MIITEKMEGFLFSIHNPVGVNLLTRLRLQLSCLNEHKFRHGFISPMCSYNTEIESKEHFLLQCPFYSSQRLELFDNLNKINSSFFRLSAKDQVHILLYSHSSNNPISFISIYIYIYIYVFHFFALPNMSKVIYVTFLLLI